MANLCGASKVESVYEEYFLYYPFGNALPHKKITFNFQEKNLTSIFNLSTYSNIMKYYL